MTITKTQAIGFVRDILDDPFGQVHVDTDITLLISATIDEMWSDILDVSPFYRARQDTITAVNSIDLRTVTAGGDLTNRLYRVFDVIRDNKSLLQVHPLDVLRTNAAEIVSPDSSYYILGDTLVMFPVKTANVEILYSYRPDAFSSLGTNDPVDWPDGHEMAFVYEAAARAMVWGDREDNEKIREMASLSWNRLISMVRRRTGVPIQPRDTQSAQSWGGI